MELAIKFTGHCDMTSSKDSEYEKKKMQPNIITLFSFTTFPLKKDPFFKTNIIN